MTKEELIALVNKGRITITGIPNSEAAAKMTREEFAKKYTTVPGKVEEILSDTDIAELIADIVSGGNVKLVKPFEPTEVIKPTENLNLNLNNNKVTAMTGSDFMDITKGIEVEVKDGEIYEALGEKDNAESVFYLSGSTKDKLVLENVKATGARIVYLNNANDEALIKSGEYTVLYNSTPAVYVQNGGKAVIEGGTFKADGNAPNKYLLNLKDALLKDNPAAKATDYIEVRGGTFVNFDPSKSDSENPQADFVASGYIVGKYDVDGVTKYVVKKYKNQPETEAKGPEGTPITWDIEGYKKRSGIVDETPAEEKVEVLAAEPVAVATAPKTRKSKKTEEE